MDQNMEICRIILILFLISGPLKAENNIKSTKIDVLDFLVLKYDIFFEKIKPRVLQNTKKGFMVHYQLVDQEIFVNKNDQIEIIISAYMNKTRYKNVKKYIPKLTDCNVIRNRMITNKNGYSMFTNKKNYSVSEELLFNQIKKNVYNLNYIDEKNIEQSIKTTNIKINIYHPLSKFNISCSGKITQLELG